MSLELSRCGVNVDGRWLVRDVSVALEPGRLVAFVGPNGSGKSTVLRLLGGLWAPTAGTAALDGRPLSQWRRRDVARRVAFVPQDTHMAFAFSVADVVAMGRHAHLGRFEREREVDRAAIARAMARADVGNLAGRPVNELSGGERQRVLIARCLAADAAHILLDEPTASLDVAHALDVLALCRALADEGRAIALALHDLGAALRFATDAVLLAGGSVAAAGPVRDVLTPDRIAAVFGVHARLVEADPGGPLLALIRERPHHGRVL